MNYQDLFLEVTQDLEDIKAGKLKGWTCGFSNIDGRTGRLEQGQLITIGGFTGTGKSYFVLNMIEGMLAEWSTTTKKGYKPPRISVFSTELSEKQYLWRHIFMRAGIYPTQYQNQPETFYPTIQRYFEEYQEERYLNPDSLNIYGNIYDFKQIEDALNAQENPSNIIVVDYVQDLAINGLGNPKDSMPLLARGFLKMAQQRGIAVILVSQVNNYAMSSGADPETNQLSPFTFGKEMVQAATTAIYLTREKKEGKLSMELTALITKARNGQLGKALFEINHGYKLKPLQNGQETTSN